MHVDIVKKTELQTAAPQNDFYFRKTNNVRTMLHGKFLSAIGPYLEMLRIRAFELEKQGDFYVVRSELLTEAHERILRNNLAEQGDAASTHLTVVTDGCVMDLSVLHTRRCGNSKKETITVSNRRIS